MYNKDFYSSFEFLEIGYIVRMNEYDVILKILSNSNFAWRIETVSFKVTKVWVIKAFLGIKLFGVATTPISFKIIMPF